MLVHVRLRIFINTIYSSYDCQHPILDYSESCVRQRLIAQLNKIPNWINSIIAFTINTIIYSINSSTLQFTIIVLLILL